MTKKRQSYTADFESTTLEHDCRVWAYGRMNINDFSDYKIGNDINEFMEWAVKQDADIYFHNLKFDGFFILAWLFRNGFTYDDDGKPEKYTFNTVISAQGGQWYKIDVTWGYTKKGGGRDTRRHVTFLDSLKKLPFPVKRIAQAFNLPILKGDIDYKAIRPIGHELTQDEIEYVKNDVEIMARALAIQFDQGLENITIGTDAMKWFKALCKKKGKSFFENSFPLLDAETDEHLRAAYKGGYTYVNPKYVRSVIKGGCVFDVNSLYPYVMYEKMLPFGRPVYFTGKYEHDDEYPLHISTFKCEFRLKKNHIPTVQIKGSRFNETEYLTSSEGEPVLLTLTSVDIQLLYDHYDVYNEEFIDGYKMRQNNTFFREYIDYWSDIKKRSEGAIRELAKLMLNSLYGKFGKNPCVTKKIPFIDDDGRVLLDVPRDYYGDKIDEYDDAVYIPMGCFITAYAREKTIRAAQENYDRFIYADTDSLHLKGKEFPTNIDIDAKELGYWAHEVTFERAKFIRQKTYIEQFFIAKEVVDGRLKKWERKVNDEKIQYDFTHTKVPTFDGCRYQGKIAPSTTNIKRKKRVYIRLLTDIKCSGMMEQVKKTVTFHEFDIGLHRAFGKLQPKSVPGGCILVDAPYTMM